MESLKKDEQTLTDEIMERVKQIYRLRQEKKEFIPSKSRVHYAGRVFDENEMTAATAATLEFWLTLGRYGAEFEKKFADFLGLRHVLVVNSGSSANLVALSALCSENIENPIRPGDEIITTAMTFPTTLSPILINRLTPVFVDVEQETYNINPRKAAEAVSDKTRAIMFAHTLGNPADMDAIMKIAKENDLYVIEDVCDALDSRYNGSLLGTFGDVSTYSFYAAHHITMGEGGAVATDNTGIFRNAISIRDWGRACYCPTGFKDPKGACGNRFGFKYDGLPEGFDHKYTYTNIGYNLKPLDVQCAIGIQQLGKLPEFTKKRKANFQKMYAIFEKYDDYFILPKAYENSDPSWFAFPLTVKKNNRFTRGDFVRYLEDKNIETRMLFGGNILRHPGYKNVERRVIGSLQVSDNVLENSFFLGVFPGLTGEMIEYVKECVDAFFD